eukprot:g9302.t1
MLPQAQTPSPHRRSLAQELGHAPQTASSPDGSHINQPLLPTPSFLSARGYAVVARVAASAQNVISKVVETKSQQLFVCKSLSLQLAIVEKLNASRAMLPINLPSAKARLAAQQEVSILKALQHPNVIGYRDSFVVEEEKHEEKKGSDQRQPPSLTSLLGSQLVIIMECATDGDLREKRLAAKAEERRIASPYIHGCRMVHRDLKSANVFISGNKVLVGDFGISKVLESTLFATTC